MVALLLTPALSAEAATLRDEPDPAVPPPSAPPPVSDTAPPEGKNLPPRALTGARGPDGGELVLSGATGMVFMIPHFTFAGRLGIALGSSLELRYRNLAAFGHAGRVRAAWGASIADDLELGADVWTSIMTLRQADGGLIGIRFSNIALGNDWELGGGAVLTWLRPGNAHVTLEVGPRWTLGGLRHTTFDDQEFQVDPELRSLDFSVQGEWQLTERLNVLVRLDGLVLINAEIRPYGFLPTGSTGVAWLL